MEKLFGLPMSNIAGCLGVALALVLLVLALAAWRSRVMFKLGLRPIPRRRAQSTLIVLGLMLATLIITAAFITGDTLSYTIRSLVIDGLGETDEIIRPGGGARSFGAQGAAQTFFKFSRYEELAAQLADYKSIDAMAPVIRESVPVVNVTRRRSERGLLVVAARAEESGFVSGAGAGNNLPLDDLGPHEVFLNTDAAKSLNAAPGDMLRLYAGPKPTTLYVQAIVAAGEGPQLFISLKRGQALFEQPGKINAILISNAGDAMAGAALSDEVTARLRSLLTDRVVAAQIYETLDSTAVDALRKAAAKQQGNTQQDLIKLADGLAAPALTDETRNLLADEGLAARVQSILADAGWQGEGARERLKDLFENLSELGVDDVKRDNLDEGELAASAFTAIFIVVGLFGIAAGLLLIFLIFVMLAAERKSEMGMTRAIGGQRGHLVQMFVFEGTAYDLAAAAVGVALGVAAGLLIALTLGQAFSGSTDLVIKPYLTLRSLIVSYSLGMLVTFATVLLSAYRVSRLNIVAAIRDLPEPPPPPTHLRDRLLAPLHTLVAGFRQLRRWRIIQALWTWFVGIPLSLLGIVWLGFSLGPLTLLLGLALLPAGLRDANATSYSLGASFIIIGTSLMLRGLLRLFLRRNPNLAERIAYTLMGVGLTVFWALPFDAFVVQEYQVGPEMFFISGIMLVGGAVLVVMYNADLLLQSILLVFGGARRWAPVLRMAIAYPLASRFRTGLTVGMFAIVVFSVVFMATAFKVNEMFFANVDALTGGYDLRAVTNSANPVPDLAQQIAYSPYVNRSDYAAIAAQSSLAVEMRQGNGEWKSYVMRGVDAVYTEHTGYDLALLADGYESAAEVWRTIRDRPGYALMDYYGVPSRQSTTVMIGGPEFRLAGVYVEDKTMPPVVVEVREPRSGATFKVTVIGVLAVGTQDSFSALTSQATLDEALPFTLSPTTHYIKLAEGVDPDDAGIALENAFLKNGLQSTTLATEIKDQQKSQRAIELLLLGFLTVGLVVGVAALGVISTRAVVERRQQIGMLRAVGFQREMVGWSFVIEASFIALLGITLGAALALIPAYHMIQDTAAQVPGIKFQVPWESIALVMGLAYGMALLTTWLPALQASRVAPAEALRYE